MFTQEGQLFIKTQVYLFETNISTFLLSIITASQVARFGNNNGLNNRAKFFSCLVYFVQKVRRRHLAFALAHVFTFVRQKMLLYT